MGRRGGDDLVLRRMLAEASAQFDVRPSDYLDGVIAALQDMLQEPRVAGARRDDGLAAHTGGRTATARARDYFLGQTATFNWILGATADPPVQPVLTEPGLDPGPDRG